MLAVSAISINHVSVHARDLEVDWPDARTLDPRISEGLIALSATDHQTGDALQATLYLDGRDAPSARTRP